MKHGDRSRDGDRRSLVPTTLDLEIEILGDRILLDSFPAAACTRGAGVIVLLVEPTTFCNLLLRSSKERQQDHIKQGLLRRRRCASRLDDNKHGCGGNVHCLVNV